jgi:hypothetical protein
VVCNIPIKQISNYNHGPEPNDNDDDEPIPEINEDSDQVNPSDEYIELLNSMNYVIETDETDEIDDDTTSIYILDDDEPWINDSENFYNYRDMNELFWHDYWCNGDPY